MFGVSDPLDEGSIIAIVGNYLFNGLVFDVLVEVVQLVGIHSIYHVPDGSMFLLGGVARVIGNNDVRSRGLTVDIKR